MRDRRRTPRYILGTPLSGDALPMEDVTVERYSKRRIVVFSQTAHDQDEQLMIHVSTTGGVHSCTASVSSSKPVSVGGALCFRIELSVADDRMNQPASPADAFR